MASSDKEIVIKSIAGYNKWVEGLKGREILYRGVENKEWEVKSSAARRIGTSENADILKYTRKLIERAQERDFHLEGNKELGELDILAKLRHQGAATLLIDFTLNSLIALWFACQQSENTRQDKEKNGKVFAIEGKDPEIFYEVDLEKMKNKINFFFNPEDNEKENPKLWKWQSFQSNPRILAQQSVFIFGDHEKLQSEKLHTCIIEQGCKQEILNLLKKMYGIDETSLFPDFDGFAQMNSESKPYTGPTLKYFIDRVIEALQRRQYNEAVTHCDEIIDSYPEKFDGHYYRGRAKSGLEKFEEAITDYDKAIKKYKKFIANNKKLIEFDPNFSSAYHNRGYAKNHLGRFKEAIDDCTKAIELNPDFSASYNNRGYAYNTLGKFTEAITDFDKAIELNPKYSTAHNNRGHTKSRLEKFEEAILDFNKAIELDPNNSTIYHNRGHTYNALEKFEEAILDFNKAIELNPNYSDAYYARGNSKSQLRKYKEALADYDKVIELDPSYSHIYCARGDSKNLLGKPEEALLDYDKAIELDQNNFTAYNNRGDAKYQLEKFSEALADFNKALELDPSYARAYYNRGLAKEALGDHEGAYENLAKAHELEPESYDMPDKHE